MQLRPSSESVLSTKRRVLWNVLASMGPISTPPRGAKIEIDDYPRTEHQMVLQVFEGRTW